MPNGLTGAPAALLIAAEGPVLIENAPLPTNALLSPNRRRARLTNVGVILTVAVALPGQIRAAAQTDAPPLKCTRPEPAPLPIVGLKRDAFLTLFAQTIPR